MKSLIETERFRADDQTWKVKCAFCGNWFEASLSTATFCNDIHRVNYHRAVKARGRKIAALERQLTDVLAKGRIGGKSPEFEALVRMGRRIAATLNSVES